MSPVIQALICGFCMQKSVFWTRITSLYGSQNSPFILCMQNSVISTGITSLYGSQPSSVVFAFKTENFGPGLQVSKVPRHDLSFCACKKAWLAPELLVYMGPSPHLWFLHAKQRLLDKNYKSLWIPAFINVLCMQTETFGTELHVSMCPRPHLSLYACKTAWLASEKLFSIGPSPHLCFLHAKQTHFDQNCMSLLVSNLTWDFVHAEQRA